MRLHVCGALGECSTCPYVYRWVDVFARPVPVYTLVNGYVGVYVYVSVNVYVAVAVYVCVCVCVSTCSSIYPSIHTYMRPSRKLKSKIETIPKFKIQFPKLEIQNPISDLRLKLKLKFQNYFSKTY